MKFFSTVGAVLLPFIAATAGGIQFNPEDEASIRSVTRQYAYGLMSLYQNNATNTPAEDVGILPKPHYWWQAGAAWGGVIEYTQFTGDNSHVKALQQALTANYGPNNDFILSYRKGQTGNDDQAFWALAAMSALEYQFPDPDQAPAAYLEVVTNAFNNIVGRWDETTCGGGLKWQIYPENAYGYNYKNSISNGCAFALGARLARYTGEQKYADWAVKIYDWTKKVGLISDKYEVFDGTDDKKNCAAVADKTQWTYNNAMFLHGSAFMFDQTKGDSVWQERTTGFLKHAELLFFRPFENATDIMYEWACETGESGRHCNLDQQSFKAYLSRFLAKTAVMAPFTKDTITKYLKASAIGAAKSCSGGADGATCGSKWYTGSWDGTSGVGQQLSALEVTQALLMIKKGTLPVKKSEAQPKPSATILPSPSSTPLATPTPALPSKALSSGKASVSTSSAVEVVYPTSKIPEVVHTSSKIPEAVPQPTPSSKTPDVVAAPSPSSKAPEVVPAPSPSSKIAEAVPKPSIIGSSSSSSIRPSAIVTPSPSSTLAATSQPGGEFQEGKPTSSACAKSGGVCTCTPSTTITVYVPAASQTTVAVVPPTSSKLIPVAPPANSSFPNPNQPEEFLGAAVNVKVTGCSLLGALFVAFVAGLL
ncbi:glycoside hydrolase family 76 protein [Cucurbitaria berberidis CBS 394.84]|uniref:mannan endo-1,6-alpha-mannosidase n=1 Tax=Cucurbitaria berberidis CBS 394.84 TaxID=1168544 RepID=A0A9P4GH93_9PLEO|nr:glycoside hydrolase family 76 protein [Cucurbitaria berberidis CBS 394.84]KAF1845401.1 glycoside hydrolase family 76 protein [Cucurbitaria berberidis CBS 394.84]